MIPPQTSLEELKNVILMNTGLVGKKDITKLTYRMSVAVANSFVYQKIQIKFDQQVSMMFSYHRSIGSIYSLELCVCLQDVGGSSSSSNNVVQPGNFGAADLMPFQEIVRALRTFNAFMTHRQTVGNRCACPPPSNQVASPEGIVDGLADTSDEDEIEDDSGEEAEVVPETQPVYCEIEDTPSNYALSGEMELEVGLKFLNRETAMLTVKNYNNRRSAEYKVVESDQARYVCRCK
ncbi:hypothetical protein Ahy_B04g071999 isoform B [Arachis hypogaea]|uniref:Transposase MuDR plant domain-containing protein n=1 Tax=Arachis hypogaea TaxID=3818 RepID=A0A444ZMF0_ARAHY|nr:hypothetical protein Ahy_B04g071999 isoform B [Arachis hypogaea]